MNNIQYSSTIHESNDQEIIQRIQQYVNESFSLSKNANRHIVVTFNNDISIETLKALDMAFISLGYIRYEE